jgi:hypothetical protein
MEEKKHMKHSFEKEQKQLFRSWTGMKLLSAFTIAEGACLVVLGCYMAVSMEVIANGIILLISGIGHILIGSWGISFSKELKFSMEGVECVVRREKGILACGIAAYVVYVLSFMFSILAWQDNAVTFGFISILVLVVLVASFVDFKMYRFEKVILKENEVIHINPFGRQEVFRAEQIQNIDFYDNQRCFYFFDKERRKLFHMSATMVGAEEFIKKFLEKYAK